MAASVTVRFSGGSSVRAAPDFRTAIVTGSTSGIGLAVARSLAEAGHAVMMNGFGDAGQIEADRSAIKAETGSPVAYHGADMSDPAQVADLVAATTARFGQIDIVVNNAGIQTVAPIEEFPVDRYNLILAINMSAAWHLCRATFGGMKARGWGRVINVASAHGLVASPYKSAYVMAKHAVVGLTKTLALLDHLGIARAAIIGSSRGGLLGMVIAATAKHRLLGLCLNDVGPILERDGLLRIGTYVGVEPTVPTLQEVADRMQTAMPGFERVPPMRWHEETVRHYIQRDGGVGLTCDPALRTAFDAALAGPLPELWPLFDGCAGLPLALIRGAASDVLSRATAEEMCRRRPDMLFAEIPLRGHIPFLDEPEALAVVTGWLDRVAAFATVPLAPSS
ncbi:MAG: SDR family NAD(P)-dependent oxidoreductase [Rhodobacter sp.]|nr:SDR family NAD(P)-dependent oxidoreductase [Rhodobacter sp.]